ncbi:glycosyltransferase [Polycladidibacter stylochi]|uniref:glycosyltransferase n=1 Tax=Polycladidibacter stylochi TaxID=1807766 RepID=UPI000836376F|nr:glycosyltransferase family 2 protein [Pseudovibrio stylochi]
MNIRYNSRELNKLALAVCTKGRPEMLKNCLKSFAELIVPDNFELFLIVCDNNSEPLNSDVLTELKNCVPPFLPIEFVHQPIPGIPFARNKALLTAINKQPHWIAFIDDDERIDSQWLIEMSKAISQWDADVYHGWTQSLPAASTNVQTIKLKNKRPSGSILKTAGTDNVLFKSCLVNGEKSNLKFNEKMQFSGGTDIEFFYRVTDQGGQIIWVPEAITRERIPESRLTIRYQAKRAYSVAAVHAYIATQRHGKSKAIARMLPKVITRFFLGMIFLALYITLSPIRKEKSSKLIINSSKKLAYSLGSIKGLFSNLPNLYKKIHGN